jgi:hypothetical protein
MKSKGFVERFVVDEYGKQGKDVEEVDLASVN